MNDEQRDWVGAQTDVWRNSVRLTDAMMTIIRFKWERFQVHPLTYELQSLIDELERLRFVLEQVESYHDTIRARTGKEPEL